MKRTALFAIPVFALLVLAQSIQVPSPRQARPGEVLPWTRFRPRAEPYLPTQEEKQQIRARTRELGTLLQELEAKHTEDTLLADTAIYHQAARWIMTYPEEFFRKESVATTLAVLDQGLERARQLQQGQSPWRKEKGRIIRGYRSMVDGSVQPFRVTIPAEYDGSRAFPLDVVIHGRATSRYEVDFIVPPPNRGPERPYLPGTIQLEVFGRGNNAYRWAGEADVFEAMAAVKRDYRVDEDRVALRGFSMGGAGVWHIALHYPSLWASVEEGAGDNQSHRYIVAAELAPHQAGAYRIFDNMNEWVLNAWNMPFLAYVGEIDGTFNKHVAARLQVAREGFTFEGESFTLAGLKVKEAPHIQFFVAPNTPPTTHPDFRKRMDEIHLANLQKGRVSPDRVRFLTYTTRYHRAHWAALDGLERHYERAEIDARRTADRTRYEITTKNLTRLVLSETERAAAITIDGTALAVTAAPQITLVRNGGPWAVAQGPGTGLRKKHGLQGPIDDAFLGPFLVVRPTGTPWNDLANRQALRLLDRFRQRYPLAYRAQVRVKDDTDVTEADFQNYNMVLFGDPGSNRWIARLQDKLPVSWTRQTVRMGHRSFPAADTVPVYVYPSPLHPSRYVVINSGLTAEWEDWAGDFPMPQYGDIAALRVSDSKENPDVMFADFFDEQWRLR